MDTSNGNLYKDEETLEKAIEKQIENMSPEEQEKRLVELDKLFKSLTKEEYDKYSRFPAAERPIARSFDNYMKQKRRFAARTPRDAFYAGYAAALADKGLTTTPAQEGVEDGSSNIEKQS